MAGIHECLHKGAVWPWLRYALYTQLLVYCFTYLDVAALALVQCIQSARCLKVVSNAVKSLSKRDPTAGR